jgi:hypothetical protein
MAQVFELRFTWLAFAKFDFEVSALESFLDDKHVFDLISHSEYPIRSSLYTSQILTVYVSRPFAFSPHVMSTPRCSVLDASVIPMGMTRNSESPLLHWNAVHLQLSGWSGIFQYALVRSTTIKYLGLSSLANMSSEKS